MEPTASATASGTTFVPTAVPVPVPVPAPVPVPPPAAAVLSAAIPTAPAAVAAAVPTSVPIPVPVTAPAMTVAPAMIPAAAIIPVPTGTVPAGAAAAAAIAAAQQAAAQAATVRAMAPVQQYQPAMPALPTDTAVNVGAAVAAAVASATADGAVMAMPMETDGDGAPSKRGRPAGAKVPRWTPEEDERLKGLVAELGERNWTTVATKLDHGRSATAVEQHYNILIGKRKKPGCKEAEEGESGAGEVEESAAKVQKAAESEEKAAAREAEKAAKAEAKAEEKARKDAEKAEKEAVSSAKKAEKEARKAKAEAEKAARDEKAKMPKKPRSSYLFYCEETREGFKKENPELGVTDLAKLQGAAWKELDDADKVKYVEKAATDTIRYKTEMDEGGFWEKEKEMRMAEAEKKGKSPSSSKKKRELDLAPFEVPEGYALAAPPTADELEFNNDAGDALVGKHLLFNWEGVGWCEGVIEERNTSKREKIGKDHVNFWVHYAVDSNTSKHNLELDNYAADGEAEFDSWVLLDKVDMAAEDEPVVEEELKAEEVPQQAPDP